ncbi:MAG: alpha/beta fold hydrolase [Thermoleophilaceae bacterium]
MPPPAPTLVLVPGFMQRGRAWAPLADRLTERYRRLCLDLRASTWSDRLAELRAAAPRGAVLVGYSMGGRLALHAALDEPCRFAGLVTIGASAGIEDPVARAERRRADEHLAAWIEDRPIEEVVAHWESLPVFATQSPELVAAQRADRLSHDLTALARLLRTGGQGALAPVWDRLPTLPTPLLALAGEREPKYADAARRMAALAPSGEAAVLAGAGHAAHFERPDAVTEVIERFVARTTGTPAPASELPD